MESNSNGKIAETQNMQQVKEDNNLVIEDVEKLKPGDESVREIAVDRNSEDLKAGDCDGDSPEEKTEDKEECSPVKDSGILEEEKVEKDGNSPQEFSSSVKASTENSDMTEMESREIDESKTNKIATAVADEELDGTKETMLPASTSDVTDGGVSEQVPSSDDKSTIATDMLSERIEEKGLPSLDQSGEVVPPASTDVMSKAVEEEKVVPLGEKTGESSSTVGKESAEYIDDSLKPSTDAAAAGSLDGFPDSTENPHVTPVGQRLMQPTSWRSCCGLFEVLRRSR